MKPCAAGDRCNMKPALADPQHKCPKCRRHIHAICGVPDVNSKNEMNSRLCFECFRKVGKSPDLNVSPASETPSLNSRFTTTPLYLHQSPTSTATATTSNTTCTPSVSLSPEFDFESEDTASVRDLYNSAVDQADKIRVLLTLSLGSTRDLSTDTRFKKHVNGGTIERGKISLRGKFEYNTEILRRAKYLVTDIAKKPRPTAWKNPKRLEWLCENGVNDVEREWAYTAFDRLMDDLDQQAEDDIIPGSNIRVTDKYKMRLYEAYFLEEFRDRFLQRNDSLKRTGLDARNSETERVKPYHEIICDKYNEESWIPTSKLFPLFHHELVDSFKLPLLSHQVLTYEQAK